MNSKAQVTVIPATISIHTNQVFSPVNKRRVAAYARVSTDSAEQETYLLRSTNKPNIYPATSDFKRKINASHQEKRLFCVLPICSRFFYNFQQNSIGVFYEKVIAPQTSGIYVHTGNKSFFF